MTFTNLRIALTAAVLILLIAAGSVMAEGTVTVSTAMKAPYSTYLVDAEGMSLYLFMADVPGEKSNCYDDCVNAWPLLLAEGELQAGGEANSALLGTIERKDGTTQVTYNGWPLYYFVKDQAPGDTTGQDINGFGADWYLVGPQGEPVHAEEAEGDTGGGSHGSY